MPPAHSSFPEALPREQGQLPVHYLPLAVAEAGLRIRAPIADWVWRLLDRLVRRLVRGVHRWLSLAVWAAEGPGRRRGCRTCFGKRGGIRVCLVGLYIAMKNVNT